MTDRRKDTIMGTFGDNSPCMREIATLYGYACGDEFLRVAKSLRQMADGKHFDPDELYSAAALIEKIAAGVSRWRA